MNTPQWTLHNNKTCSFFELRDSLYSMKFTVKTTKNQCRTRCAPTFLQQIHSSLIIDIDHDTSRIGDGLLSKNMRNVLGIKVADCLPVYLYNDTTMCIIHCGWRSIIGGIARHARKCMGTFSYVLGACIGPECYEVQPDVAAQFNEHCAIAVLRNKGRFFLDLKKAVILDLGEESLVATLDLCTKCHPEYFFSYRRGDRKKRNYALISRT